MWGDERLENSAKTSVAMSSATPEIRPATAADDEAIGEVLVAAFVTAYGKKMPEVVVTDARKAELRATAQKRLEAHVLVAELEGRVVGTLTLFRPGSPGSEAWLPGAADLRHLATLPEFHGRGLSHALMDEAERTARAWGVPAICLHVRRGAQGVARLYARRGYLRDPAGDFLKAGTQPVALEAYVLRLNGAPSP